MRRTWWMAAVVVALLVGTVAVAQAARGGWGQGAGPGMMGGGGGRGDRGMMGGGQGCLGSGTGPANYDAAVTAARANYMLAEQKAALTNLQSQLAAATDETVKARLTVRSERQTLMVGRTQAAAAVWQTQPKTWLEGATAVAQAEIDYWTKATATDATNQAWITLQLQTARARLTNLQTTNS